MKRQYSVYANAGALILFPSEMAKQERQDAQHSILFAQLAATKKYPITGDQDKWYSIWLQVLKESWLQRKVEWNAFTPKQGDDVQAMEGICSLLSPSLKNADVGDWVTVLRSIAELPATDPAIGFLRERVQQAMTREEGKANVDRYRFLVIVMQPGPRLNAAFMTLKASVCDEGNPFARVLGANMLSGAIEQRFFQAELAAPLFDPIRDGLIKRLEPFMGQIREISSARPDDASPVAGC